MRVNRVTTSLVAAVMGAIIFAPIQPASAALKARVNNNALSIQTGRLLVFSAAAQSFSNPQAALSTAINGVPKNFWVNNGGSLTVSRFTMTITLPNNSNISAFRRCNANVSFTGTNTCASGSPTTLTVPTSGVAATYIISLTGSGFYSFQIDQNKSGTLTVSTSASLANVSGSVTNS